MASKGDPKPTDAAAGAAVTEQQQKPPVGDSTAVSTQAAPEPTTPSVFKVGDSFPWEYRDTVQAEDGSAKERRTPVVATITNLAHNLVWCDLTPPETLPEKDRAQLSRSIGFPRRVHVMNADAAKALGRTLPPRSE